jgi:hypothetical protein
VNIQAGDMAPMTRCILLIPSIREFSVPTLLPQASKRESDPYSEGLAVISICVGSASLKLRLRVPLHPSIAAR